MLEETFWIHSALHTQIFLDFLYVIIGPSISTKKQFFVSVSVFPTFTNISSSLTLLLVRNLALTYGSKTRAKIKTSVLIIVIGGFQFIHRFYLHTRGIYLYLSITNPSLIQISLYNTDQVFLEVFSHYFYSIKYMYYHSPLRECEWW